MFPAPKVYRDKKPAKGLKPRNDERAAAKFISAFLSSEYVEFVHSLGCCIPGCKRTDIEAAHCGPTRKNGGRWFEIAPLCGKNKPGHHQEQEGQTGRMNAKYGIDLLDIAAATALRWRERSE